MISRRVLAGVVAIALASAVAVSLRAQPPVAGREQAAEEQERLDSTSSGFILTNSGYIVTTHRGVEGATRLGVRIPGRETPAPIRLVAEDVDDDLAIVKTDDPLGTPPISFVDPKDVKVGQSLLVLGYPPGLSPAPAVRASSVSVSSLFGPRNSLNVYQISPAIEPGGSGGPVFTDDGQLVGVVASQFVIKSALIASLLEHFPDGAEVLRRNTKLTVSREPQVESLSKWVVQILNFRPAITTASHEYRRSPAAWTRVDLLGGRLAYWVDLDKWTETNPDKKGVPQQFMMTKGQSRAGVMIEVDPSTKPIDEMRASVMKELLSNMPDARIANQERRVVNGLPMLVMYVDATGPNGPIACL